VTPRVASTYPLVSCLSTRSCRSSGRASDANSVSQSSAKDRSHCVSFTEISVSRVSARILSHVLVVRGNVFRFLLVKKLFSPRWVSTEAILRFFSSRAAEMGHSESLPGINRETLLFTNAYRSHVPATSDFAKLPEAMCVSRHRKSSIVQIPCFANARVQASPCECS